MDKNSVLGRSEELKELKEFVASKKSGFVYVRGRRRVGKSALLKKLQNTTPNVFYFFGSPDSTMAQLHLDFAAQWDQFTGKVRLSDLKNLTWSKIFSEITDYVRQNRKSITLIFDETQWIAKVKSGCVGAIKQAWQDWELINIKVI